MQYAVCLVDWQYSVVEAVDVCSFCWSADVSYVIFSPYGRKYVSPNCYPPSVLSTLRCFMLKLFVLNGIQKKSL